MRRGAITCAVLCLVVWGGAAGAGRAAPPALPPVTVEIVPATVVVGIDRLGPYETLGEAYPGLVAFARERGLTIAGPAVGHFYDDPMDVRAERRRSTALLPVVDPGRDWVVAPAGGITLRRGPPRLLARTLHVGPYAGLRATHERLARALPSLALRYVGPMVEVYLDDPRLTPPEVLRTDVGAFVEPTAKTDLGLYAGPGADAEGLRALSQVAFAAGLTQRPLPLDGHPEAFGLPALSKAVRAVVVPGGWAPDAVAALGREGAAGLASFVRGGGGYLGVCAGAYLACKTVVWEGEAHTYPLALLDGVATGPVPALAPWPEKVGTTLTWESAHPVVAGLAKARRVLYFGGPRLTTGRDDVVVLGRYPDGGAALVAFTAGRGRVLLSSAHLEGRPDPPSAHASDALAASASDGDRDREGLARCLRWVAGKAVDLPR